VQMFVACSNLFESTPFGFCILMRPNLWLPTHLPMDNRRKPSGKLKGLGDHMLCRSNWKGWKSRENAREMLSP